MKRFLQSLLVAVGVLAALVLPAGVASASGTTSFCTTGNSQAAFLVKAVNDFGDNYDYYVPIGTCAGAGQSFAPASTPFAFHVPTGWCAEFLKAPNGKHYTARGADGGSGGQWVRFAPNSFDTGQWWARHYRC